MIDLLFNNKKASELGAYLISRPDIPSPERRITTYSVVGRDGVLVDDEGTYNPIVIPVHFNFKSKLPETFRNEWRIIKSWLSSRKDMNLKLTDDEEVYFKVISVNISDVSRKLRTLGTFSVDFTCQPFEYLESGNDEIIVTENNVDEDGFEINSFSIDVDNLYYISEPVYIMTGNGTATLTVNGNDFNVTVGDNLIINTELQLAYRMDGTVINQNTSGDFEKLKFQQGHNEVEFFVIAGEIDLKLLPKWRAI